MPEIAFRLRVSECDAATAIDALCEAKLIDINTRGRYIMHDWEEHQYVSDNSTERVRKHRAKRSGNVSETPPEQNRTETEQNRTQQSAETLQQPTLITQHEYPETLRTIQEHDRAADAMFCVRLADTVARAIISHPVASQWPPGKAEKAVCDATLARACRESYATPGRAKNHGTGLLLTTVPNIIIGGKTTYA